MRTSYNLMLFLAGSLAGCMGGNDWPEIDEYGSHDLEDLDEKGPASYEVEDGGTCWAAAQALGCAVEDIVNCTGSRDCWSLWPGDRLSCGECGSTDEVIDVDEGAGVDDGADDGADPYGPLDVPYYYQHHNAYEPEATCGLTSAAMVVSYSGTTVTPDTLYQRYGKSQGQSPGNLAALYRAEIGYGQGTYSGTRAMIRAQIDAGRPVVIHGYFTGSGHVLVVVGYDNNSWIIHDPAGRWDGCYACGYPSRTSTNGRFVHYPESWLSPRVIGVDGDIWMSVPSTTPFSL